MSDQQPILAAALSALFPGLGHAYLGAWGRSLVWLSTVIAAVALVVWETGIDPDAYDAVVPFLRTVFAGVSPLGIASVVLLMSANVLDAFRIGQVVEREESAVHDEASADRTGEDLRTCPECGREVEDDLDFCHWCTTEFEE